MISYRGTFYNIDQIPPEFSEIFIISGYRKPCSSIKQCLISTLQINNELVNIWTHLLSAAFFFWYLYMELHQLTVYELYAVPYLFLICSAILFTTASAFAHTFNVLSENARHVCFIIDYAAIGLHSMVASIAMRSYSFPERLIGTFCADWYLPFAAVMSIHCTFFSCKSRFINLSQGICLQVLRLAAFAIPFFVDHIGVYYRWYYCAVESEDFCDQASQYYRLMMCSCILSGILYSSHIPERFWPQRFDILGHSHQIFHCTVVLGTYYQLHAVKTDMITRRDFLLQSEPELPIVANFWFLVIPFLINVAIVVVYSTLVYRTNDWTPSSAYPRSHGDCKTD